MSLAEVIQGVDSFLSDSPINMVKWGSVFVVIIIGYIVLIKSKIIMKIVKKWEYKRDIAISRNHVVEAKLISEYPYGEAPNYEWHAKYSYVIVDSPNDKPVILPFSSILIISGLLDIHLPSYIS